MGVLTTSPWTGSRPDPGLRETLSDEVEVLTTHAWDPYHLSRRVVASPRGRGAGPAGGNVGRRRWLSWLMRAVLFPNPTIGWWGPAVKVGERAIRESGYDVIVSTQPPITSHVVGRTLAHRTGRPWVADYRDIWVDGLYDAPPTPVHRWASRRLEQSLLRDAAAIVAVTDPMRERLSASGSVPPAHTITNGFDADQIAAAVPSELPRPTVLYLGTVVDPCAPWMMEMIDALGRHPARPHLLYVGNSSAHVEQAMAERARKAGMEGRYRSPGFVSHAEAMGMARSATALWLNGCPDATYSSSSKIYEYLATGRPLLALLRRQTLPRMAEIIESSGGGVAAPGKPSELDALLDRVLRLGPREVLPDYARDYSWQSLGRRYADLLSEVCDRGGEGR